MKTYNELSLNDKKTFKSSKYLVSRLDEFKKYCTIKHKSFEDAINANGTYWAVLQVGSVVVYDTVFFVNENKALLQYIKDLEMQTTSSKISIRAYKYDEQFYNDHNAHCMIEAGFKYRLLDIL